MPDQQEARFAATVYDLVLNGGIVGTYAAGIFYVEERTDA